MYPVLFVVLALLPSGQNPVLGQHVLDVAQHVSARSLDRALEDKPFDDWFKALVGDSSKVTWTVTAGCDGVPRTTRDLPMCGEAVANLTRTRRVVVKLIVDPQSKVWLLSAAILDGNDVKSFKTLPELAMAVRAK